MLKITDLTKTWFEVILWEDLDEICQENSFPMLDDVSCNFDWPYFEWPWEYEFEIEIAGDENRAKLTILADILVYSDLSFEIFWDEDYVISKLFVLNWKY